MSKLPIMVFVASILVASSVMLTVPAASALTTRDFSYLNDNHLTVRYGNTGVCGDHMCAPGEWDKLVTSLNDAQRSNQAGWTAKSTTTSPSYSGAPTTTPTPPITTNATAPTTNSTMPTYPPVQSPPTSASTAACNSIESMLNTAGVSQSVITKVMTDLSCNYQ